MTARIPLHLLNILFLVGEFRSHYFVTYVCHFSRCSTDVTWNELELQRIHQCSIYPTAQHYYRYSYHGITRICYFSWCTPFVVVFFFLVRFDQISTEPISSAFSHYHHSDIWIWVIIIIIIAYLSANLDLTMSIYSWIILQWRCCSQPVNACLPMFIWLCERCMWCSSKKRLGVLSGADDDDDMLTNSVQPFLFDLVGAIEHWRHTGAGHATKIGQCWSTIWYLFIVILIFNSSQISADTQLYIVLVYI